MAHFIQLLNDTIHSIFGRCGIIYCLMNLFIAPVVQLYMHGSWTIWFCKMLKYPKYCSFSSIQSQLGLSFNIFMTCILSSIWIHILVVLFLIYTFQKRSLYNNELVQYKDSWLKYWNVKLFMTKLAPFNDVSITNILIKGHM